MQEKVKYIMKIQRCFRGWRYRKKLKRQLYELLKEQNLEGLLVSYKDLREKRAIRVIKQFWKSYKYGKTVRSIMERSCLMI
jgi:hypothetical protein